MNWRITIKSAAVNIVGSAIACGLLLGLVWLAAFAVRVLIGVAQIGWSDGEWLSHFGGGR